MTSQRFCVEFRDEDDNGWSSPRFVLIDTKTGEEVGSDGGQPEDQLLVRDWAWVPELLNKMNKMDAENIALQARVAELEAEMERERAAGGIVAQLFHKNVAKQELGWRKMLWLSHGCPFEALYGDDGEMHCVECRIDFKRDSPEYVAEVWEQRGAKGSP